MSTTENDIEELEGPFEQIAGALSNEGEGSSSSTCSVSIKVVGPLVDQSGTGNLRCVIQVTLTGCDPKEASYSLTTKPTAPNPQNLAGTTAWKFKTDALDATVINAGPIWYGSGPDNLCYQYKAPYELTLTASCPNCTCKSEPIQVEVTLPDQSSSIASFRLEGAGPKGEVFTVSDPFAVSGIPNSYKCFATLYGWRKVSTVIINDHISQYRDLIKQEEVYHTKQFEGKVDFDHGAIDDFYTLVGIKWWLSYAGSSVIPYYGNTAAEASKNAFDAVIAAVTKENKFCDDLYPVERRPYLEFTAKKAVGFKEAWTFPCAYPEYKNLTYPPNPKRHPAYA